METLLSKPMFSAESKATTNTGKGEGASVRDDTSSVASGSMEGRKHKKKRKKDFIKRNKEVWFYN